MCQKISAPVTKQLTSKMMGAFETPPPWEAQSAGGRVKCRMLFESTRWRYPVYAFIGKTIRDAQHSFDYYETEQSEHYCCLANEILNDKDCAITDDVMEVIAHDVLNSFSCNPKTEYASITKEAAIFLLGTYSKETFEYLVRSFAVKLKTKCLLVVLQKISKIIYTPKIPRDIDKRRERFRDNQIKVINMETRKAAACLDCLDLERRISPMDNLSLFNVIMQRPLPGLSPLPVDNHEWLDHLSQECAAQLDWVLKNEKSDFVMKVIDCRHLSSYLKEDFKKIMQSKSLNMIEKFRESINKLYAESNKPLHSIICV